MGNLKKYLITYVTQEGEEDIMEIFAYSEDQAVFLSSLPVAGILDVSCVVAMAAGGA